MVLDRPLSGGLRRDRVDDAGPARAGPAGRAGRDHAGVGQDAEVPAHGVRVEADPAGELLDVEPVGRAAELLDDLDAPLVRERAMESRRGHLSDDYRANQCEAECPG